MGFGENASLARILVEAEMPMTFEIGASDQVDIRKSRFSGEADGKYSIRDPGPTEGDCKYAAAAKIANPRALRTQAPVPDQDTRKPPVGTLLIDSRSLFREGIKIMLRHSGYSVIAEADNVAAALSTAVLAPAPQLILYGLHLDNMEGLDPLKALRAAFGASRLVVQADPIIEPAFVLESFRLGVDAWLTLRVSPTVLVRSLDLVMSGERIFPAAAIVALTRQKSPVAAAMRGGEQHVLSSREARILSCLAEGHSNKMIARELNVTDGTVKFLLKALFQKIGAANRTQAAIWANGGRPTADSNRA